jgi:hypothetical protein
MYVLTKHNKKLAEWMEPQNLRGTIGDVEKIVENNKVYKRRTAEMAVGRPGHYFGRDVVLEGAMPIAAFIAAPAQFGGDQDWWKDDATFQEYMKRHPAYNWLKE